MTKTALLLSVLLATVPTPAHATGNGTCRALLQPDLRLELVIGQGPVPSISQVRVRDGDRTMETGDANGVVLSQSWLDELVLNLQLAAPGSADPVVRLRTFRRRGNTEYAGTLVYGGRTYQARCRLDD